MSELAKAKDPEEGLPLAPSEETWRAMTPAQREAFLVEVNMALEAEAELMSESRPHSRAKSKALDKLGQHFRMSGKKVYLASELAVHYPGEKPFAPDIMAVLGVEDPGDADERDAWVVVDEGKGLDLALEVWHRGNQHKDFVRNVETYARLGIPEYFIYDRRNQRLLGYRLPSPGAKRYRPLRSRFGRYTSEVLGLDLAVLGGTLRFFQGAAEIFDSEELIDQLGRMVEELEGRWGAAEARAEQEQARAEQEQARAEQEQARAEQEQARAEQEQARATRALAWLRDMVLRILGSRGLAVGEELAGRIRACEDADQLGRLAERALTVARAEEIFD
jgi:Uma2 family endonuclease